MSLYAEHKFWHVIRDGEPLCGAETGEPMKLEIIPRPLCWRCREARAIEVEHQP